MIGSSDGRGFCFITSGAGVLNPNAVAGGPLIPKMTQSKCVALKGSGKPATAANNIAAISLMLQLIKKHINAYIFA